LAIISLVHVATYAWFWSDESQMGNELHVY